MLARIDGGPLQAKHQAAVVIHPVFDVTTRYTIKISEHTL
jgi:hypothetical protein